MRRLLVSGLAVCLLMLVRCGGGSEGTGSSASILGTVNSQEALGALTSSEKTEICGNIRHAAFEAYGPVPFCNYLTATMPYTFLNVEAAKTREEWRAQCEQAKPICEKTLGTARSEAEVCAADPNTKICMLDDPGLKSCKETVRLFADCVLNEVVNDQVLYTSFNCDNGFDWRYNGEHPGKSAEVKTPDACTALWDACPATAQGASASDCNYVFDENDGVVLP